MATLIIKTNAAQGTDVLIADVGVFIPASGGQETFIENDEIFDLQESQDLRDFLTDDAFGALDSTLVLNDGTTDIAQSDALNFLTSLILPSGDQDFGVVKTNASGQISDTLTFDGVESITGLPTPVNASDAATKSYVDQLVTSNRTFKELLLSCVQLDSANDAISRAIPFWFLNNPSDGDTLILTDGSVTETFTFNTSAAGAFSVQIGASVADTLTNLAFQINTDSTAWSGLYTTDLSQINASLVVIYRKDNSTLLSPDRIYGSFTTASDAEYVNYNGELDYALSTSSVVPAADPGEVQFGFGRLTSELTPSETHVCRDDDTLYTWDADSGVWQNTGSNSPALQDSKVVGKWMQFGSNTKVPNNGIKYLSTGGNVATSSAGIILLRAGIITGASLRVSTAEPANVYNLSIRINGTEVGVLTLSATNTSAFTTAISQVYAAGDELSLALVRTSGSGKSTFATASVLLEINEATS